MIRDNDGKFQGSFDTALKRIGMEAKKTPIRAPNANAFVESWISHARSECLNYFGLIFGLDRLTGYWRDTAAITTVTVRIREKTGLSQVCW